MKVGSERKVASSPRRPNSGIAESGRLNQDYAQRDPQKFAYLRGPLSPERSLSVAEMWCSKRQSSISTHEKRQKNVTIRWPAVYQKCTQMQHFPSTFFRLWAPKPAPEPSPEVPKLCGTATPGPALRRLVLYRPFTRTLPFLQGSCN